MMRLRRVRATAFAIAMAVCAWLTPHALATVFEFNGEIFFCTTTCDSFGALGGQTGGSGNTVNSVVSGTIDVPVQGDGSFSFLATDNVPFNFSISTTAIPEAPPVFGPQPDCPPPNVAGQLCNPTTVNPLPLDSAVATVEGSGSVGAGGSFDMGTLTFTFIVPPFSNNGAVVVFDLSDSSAEGTVFGGAVVFTRISGLFAPSPPIVAVSLPVPDPFPNTLVGETATADVTVSNTGLNPANITLDTAALVAPFSITGDTCTGTPVATGGGTCVITAQFAPTADGMETGTFNVLSDDPMAMSSPVTLVGNGIVPEIDVMPNPLNFADTAIGSSASLAVTVTNTGSADLVIPAAGVTAPALPFSISADTCTDTTIVPMGTCSVTVDFAPTAAGPAMSSFQISSNDPNEMMTTVDVSGAGAEPDITVSPLALVFPSLVAGQTQTRNVTISNDGSADLVMGMIDGAQFVAPFSLLADTCSMMTLTPAATCTLMIDFAPAGAGDFTNNYDIPSNDADEMVVAASVMGTATAAPEPFITADPTALSLGDVIVSQMTMATISLINDGSADLIISGIDVGGTDAGDFTQSNDCATVVPAGTCTVTVTFAPSAVGARGAMLTVNSNATNDMALPIPLSGTGLLGPQLSVEVTTLAVGSAEAPIEIDDTGQASFMLVSAGSEDVTVSAVTLSGSTDFAVDAAACTQAALPPMANCAVGVTFSPTSPGDKMATVTIASNDVDQPMMTVELTGFVLVGSRPDFSASDLVIGTSTAPVTVGESGSSDIVITSTGSDVLTVISVLLAGADAAEFTLSEDCTAAAVARGATCTITVTFTPASPGTKTAEVQITTDAPTIVRAPGQTTVVVPIAATAVAPPPPPPPPAGSQTNTPPGFATGDSGSAGACFIATAAYGSYLDPNVKVLRDFRDKVLLTTSGGRKFVKFYYHHSPAVADYIARHEFARTATRYALTPLVYALAHPMPALLVLLGVWALLVKRRRRFA